MCDKILVKGGQAIHNSLSLKIESWIVALL